MLTAIQVAEYFLAKDPERNIFNLNLIERNNRKFYEGNARLNKYLHISQNVYIAMTGGKLFSDDLYAYDNGAVAVNVQEGYKRILLMRDSQPDIPDNVQNYLDTMYSVLLNADIDDLIAISHEDPEWIAKHNYYSKPDQRMDSLSRAEEYKEQYKDLIKVMSRMTA